MHDDKCTLEQCYVDAPEFLHWWNRLSELVLQHRNNKEYGQNLRALTQHGLEAGALIQTGIYGESDINDDFDWKHGKIDFALVPLPEWYGNYNPKKFITYLQQVSRPN